MIRLLCVALAVAALAGGVPSSRAQPPPGTLGSNPALDEARQLTATVEKLFAEGKFQEAIPLAQRSLSLREKTLGPMHPDVARDLNSLAEIFHAQGAYAKAEPFYVRALSIREGLLGSMHRDVAESLNNLAGLYADQGPNGKAEPLYVRALAIREKALGLMNPDVAETLNDLALLYKAQGKYARAEPLYARALLIAEKTLGSSHPYVALCMNNLAGLYLDIGAYAKAEPLLLRALFIREQGLEPTHLDLATSLNNLAVFYKTQGAYGKAEPLYVRALSIRERTLGPGHPRVAQSLINLAAVYFSQGAYAKAEALNLRALRLAEKALGPMHPDLAFSLADVAAIYERQGAYEKAERLYIRALVIREKALGPTHLDVAKSLDDLAYLYQWRGVYEKAESLYLRALAIRERAVGVAHALVAMSMNSLANLYQAQGMYDKAEPLYIRALGISENAMGPMHWNVAAILTNLACLYTEHGSHERAVPLMARVIDIQEEGLRVDLARLSEPRKRALMAHLEGEANSAVSLHVTHSPGNTRALELALTTVLQRKGRILDSLIEQEMTLRAHLTPRLRAQLDRLAAGRTELVGLLYGSRSAMDLAAITDARTRIEEVESALSAASAEFRVQSEPVTVAKIQAALPRGAALVELVRYRRQEARQGLRIGHEERYVAYLLTARGPAQWVELGAAAALDTEIDAALAVMDRKVAPEIAKAALRRLDALVLAPLRARLTGISHVIVAPDSKLNLVPFEVLVDSQGHYALERYLVSYMTTGRDLLRLGVRHRPRSSAVIVAGPDYGPVLARRAGGTVSFAPLVGALGEAGDLRPYFSTKPLTGPKATKSTLKALTGPAMLHVATHGFYARDAGTAPRTATAGPAVAQQERERGMFVDDGFAAPSPPPSRSEDPIDALDRAGLALAGANQGADGILTARELAGLDLWGTQLVVLSACETGVGVVPSGEGVYGLRRALVLAGAESQVVTLWSVSDSATRELMRDFYGELSRGTGRAEALRQAKLRLMRQPGRAHPYYWAAFIPAGDWRPLSKSSIRQ